MNIQYEGDEVPHTSNLEHKMLSGALCYFQNIPVVTQNKLHTQHVTGTRKENNKVKDKMHCNTSVNSEWSKKVQIADL